MHDAHCIVGSLPYRTNPCPVQDNSWPLTISETSKKCYNLTNLQEIFENFTGKDWKTSMKRDINPLREEL